MKYLSTCLLIIFYFSSFSQEISMNDLVNSNFKSLTNSKSFIQHKFSPQSFPGSAGNNCYDSSFTKSFSFTNQYILINNILHTSDDEILVCGGMYDTTRYPAFTHYNGFISKIDNRGNMMWIKQIEDIKTDDYSFVGVYTLKELSTHEIIAVAAIDSIGGFNAAALVLKLSENGDLIWYKSLQTSLYPSSQYYSLTLNHITEAANGDLIFCGTSTDFKFSHIDETIFRMNAQGDVIWSDDFTNNNGFTAGATGISSGIVNGNIVEFGLSFGGIGNEYIPAINFLTLDYLTGNLLYKTFYVPDYTDTGKSQRIGLVNAKTKMLKNGHYIIYGEITQGILLNDTAYYFGVAEFDASFNLINSYLISSFKRIGTYVEDIEVADNGKIYYLLSEDVLNKGDNLYVISDNGSQTSKSRKIYYDFDKTAGTVSPLALFNDNGYGFVRSSDFTNSNQFNFEFKKFHDVDTTSDCFGTDSLLTIHAPYNLKQEPAYKYLDDKIPGKVKSSSYSIAFTDFINYNSENKCVQQNNCDSIRIHGNPNICGPDGVVYFTAARNKNCGAFAQWNMDTAIYNSLKQVNDTTVGITFKSVNWDGKLYVHLATASCNINEPQDSIELHIKAQPVAKLNLGADTIFCKNTPLLLHAGPDFKKYTWQNNSTDSLFTATKTGKYFVTVNDLCNNIQSDTISVTEASEAFIINNDTAKCNNDTISLKAPLGFTNYEWQPNYNLQTVANNIVLVNPSIDTTYFASANLANCSVSDEVHIHVFHSPSINLGSDTSLCYGTKLLLNAGGGFNQYVWNTGAKTQSINAGNVGSYNIKATDNNNCASYDTINIIAIKQLPFVNLGNDTTLCSGDEFILTPEIKNADTYYWQDGSSSSNMHIKQQEEYSITALNTCGSYKDSIKISESLCQLILPTAFTPNNDGLNDIFRVKYPFPVKNFKMIIYNRWGQQIFISEDMGKGWDGNYKGTPVNQSTYVCIVTITDMKNTTTTLHGTVTVIR